MVKTLGYYGSAPVGLIEDSEVKRDEKGVEVILEVKMTTTR